MLLPRRRDHPKLLQHAHLIELSVQLGNFAVHDLKNRGRAHRDRLLRGAACSSARSKNTHSLLILRSSHPAFSLGMGSSLVMAL